MCVSVCDCIACRQVHVPYNNSINSGALNTYTHIFMENLPCKFLGIIYFRQLTVIFVVNFTKICVCVCVCAGVQMNVCVRLNICELKETSESVIDNDKIIQ